MTASRFTAALAFVLAQFRPPARTPGIDVPTLQRWRILQAVAAWEALDDPEAPHPEVDTTDEDLAALTAEEAAEIWRAFFWAPMGGDALPAGVDLVMLDVALLQSPGHAVRYLQDSLELEIDHHVEPGGPTLEALAALPPTDRAGLIALITTERTVNHGHGADWRNERRSLVARFAAVQAEALAWVETPPGA